MFFESSSDGFIFVHKKTESTFSGCLKNSYKTKKVITHLLLTLRIDIVIEIFLLTVSWKIDTIKMNIGFSLR